MPTPLNLHFFQFFDIIILERNGVILWVIKLNVEPVVNILIEIF